jgi:galactokinase/mevalonate kinase-like predicted kinase
MMKAKPSAKELTEDLENDLALVMLIEKRHSARIGSRQARDLIEKIKDALCERDETQEIVSNFPIH